MILLTIPEPKPNIRSGTQTEALLWSSVTTTCRESLLRRVNPPAWSASWYDDYQWQKILTVTSPPTSRVNILIILNIRVKCLLRRVKQPAIGVVNISIECFCACQEYGELLGGKLHSVLSTKQAVVPLGCQEFVWTHLFVSRLCKILQLLIKAFFWYKSEKNRWCFQRAVFFSCPWLLIQTLTQAIVWPGSHL